MIAVSAQFDKFFRRQIGLLIFSPRLPLWSVFADFWYIPQACWDVVSCLNLMALCFQKRGKSTHRPKFTDCISDTFHRQVEIFGQTALSSKTEKLSDFYCLSRTGWENRDSVAFLTAFPPRLVKRTLLFWKRAVLGHENRLFQKTSKRGAGR